MKKKDQGRIWWWLSLFVVAAIALIVGYYIGLGKGRVSQKVPPGAKIRESKGETSAPDKEKTPAKETVFIKEPKESGPIKLQDSCRQIEKGVQELFQYLNTKNYILHIEEGIHTYDRFKRLLNTLASHPPINVDKTHDTCARPPRM